MKYLPTTFPHTCTPWLNPPSHYKLKSYFYFLLPSLSLCLNYVFLAEKNFNLSYSPKILAYIFFFFFSRVTGAPGNPVPHFFLLRKIRKRKRKRKIRKRKIRKRKIRKRKIRKRAGTYKIYLSHTRNICYLQNIIPKNFSQPKPKPTDIIHYTTTIQTLLLSSLQFPFFCLFRWRKYASETLKGNPCHNRKVTSQCGLYHPTTLLPIMVTILCFLTPMSIHLSSDYLILCKNVKLSHKT